MSKDMLRFQRGTTADSMTNFAAIKVETNGETTANTLRKALSGKMLKSDCFLDVHGFPVANSTDDETSTLLGDLLVAGSSSQKSGEKSTSEESGLSVAAPGDELEIKVVRILAKEEKKREALKLGDWPKDPGFWSSDIMNDAVLPAKNAPGIVAPEGTADLSAFLDVNSFGIVQWAELIKSNNLLKGVRMGSSGPRPSAFAMFEGPPDLENFYTFRQPNAYIDVQTVTSEHTSKFITQGWQTGSLSVGTPFVSIAVEGEKHQMSGSNTLLKTIFTTAFYKYAFVTIVFDPTTLTPTTKFKSAVTEALNKGSDDAKRAALRNLFDRYGHAFQTEVTLGAMLTTTDSIKTDTNMTQSKFEDSMKAKLSAAIPSYGIEVGASYGTGKQEERQTKDMNQEERKIITAKGGNPLLSTALAKWIPSIADYRTWRVIEVGAAVPITEFVDAGQKEEVARLSNADPGAYTRPLRGRWVEAVEHMTNAQGDGNTWFRAYRPALDDGWYWLGQSLDGRYALQVRENGSQGGALGLVHDASLIHKNDGSKAKDWELFWQFWPVDTNNYVILGDQFQSGNSARPDTKPDMTSAELSRLRAVRKDLCVRATISVKPFWSNETTKDTKWVTVYQVVSTVHQFANTRYLPVNPVYSLDNSLYRPENPYLPEDPYLPQNNFGHPLPWGSEREPGLDLYLFKAFEKSPSEMAAGIADHPVYMLKEGSIFIENPR